MLGSPDFHSISEVGHWIEMLYFDCGYTYYQRNLVDEPLLLKLPFMEMQKIGRVKRVWLWMEAGEPSLPPISRSLILDRL